MVFILSQGSPSAPAATVMRKQELHKLEFKTWVEQNPPAGRRVYSSPFVEDPSRIIRDHHIMLGALMENVKNFLFQPGPWYRDRGLGESPLAGADLSFIEESSTTEL